MNLSIATIILIGANIIASYKGFQDPLFFDKYKFQIGPIRGGEYLRMLTSGFLHVDVSHLLFNMITLYFFAPIVSRNLGDTSFISIYIISLLAGSLLALKFHKSELQYSAVGASGAVTGVLYAAILLNPGMSLYFFFIPIPIPAYLFGIGYLLYSIYGMKKRIGNIGHTAHFGGAVGGYLATIAFRPSVLFEETFMVVLLAIPIILLFILERKDR